jgi:sugar-specific transcriptional regulator TrmB
MKQTTALLKKLGLTDTEIKIYLTGLGYSSTGVSELVKQTRINRTTIYHALDTLMQKGLVAKKNIGIKQVFSMTDPTNIKNLIDEKISLLKEQKKELDTLVPLLQKELLPQDNQMKVSHYEGIEGIKLVVEDALYCKSKNWDIIAPVKNFFSEFDKDYAKYFVQTRKQRSLTSRSLWETSPSHKDLSPEVLKERNPRILPSVMHGKFKSVICLYDDKVLVISSLKELSAVLIQSKEMNETMSAIYEGLWLASNPL